MKISKHIKIFFLIYYSSTFSYETSWKRYRLFCYCLFQEIWKESGSIEANVTRSASTASSWAFLFRSIFRQASTSLGFWVHSTCWHSNAWRPRRDRRHQSMWWNARCSFWIPTANEIEIGIFFCFSSSSWTLILTAIWMSRFLSRDFSLSHNCKYFEYDSDKIFKETRNLKSPEWTYVASLFTQSFLNDPSFTTRFSTL